MPGRSRKGRYNVYKSFVAQGIDQAIKRFLALKQTSFIIGDEAFKLDSPQPVRIISLIIDQKGQ
jgi:hypothetical protein